MPKDARGARLERAETTRLLDCYMQYRFRQVLSAGNLAKKAGVKPAVAHCLLEQQPVDDADLNRVAHALGMSARLLRQICGLEEMSNEMLEAVSGFLAQTVALKERALEAH